MYVKYTHTDIYIFIYTLLKFIKEVLEIYIHTDLLEIKNTDVMISTIATTVHTYNTCVKLLLILKLMSSSLCPD